MTAEVSRRNMIAGTVGMAGMLPVLAEAATGAVKAPGNATGFTPPADAKPPSFEFAFQIRIELGERLRYGPTYWGLDRGFVGVLGGSVIGPRFSGKVIPHSGGDWPTIRPDNSVRFDARYLLQADDGTIVALHNTGIRHADKAVLDRMQRYEHVDPSEYYMGLTPRFEAPEGPHEWLSQTIFVGKADRDKTHSIFTYWAMV
ncbi:DUF3237 family protein [Novosphingobium pokkalii]|uniref:UPF0311 protein ACFOOT_20270 n=1 Tax=Novosphingobium pokkalii TaxID=1770194 RepID=A0ABV7V9K1_9SPHN|nr:DUF3237 family protein [Novosphingobium pokkalii]GHD00991.1 hypothetical protein GCM10019060_35000 [Novosphingobium pokkalii]